VRVARAVEVPLQVVLDADAARVGREVAAQRLVERDGVERVGHVQPRAHAGRHAQPGRAAELVLHLADAEREPTVTKSGTSIPANSFSARTL
jgi:hypothetical protein